MNVLKRFNINKKLYFSTKSKFEKLLKPLEHNYNNSLVALNEYILKNKLYIPIEKLDKYEGLIEDITVVYDNIIDEYEFVGYTIKNGILKWNCEEHDNYYVVTDNPYVYRYISYDFGYSMKTINMLGFYNLDLGNGIIKETSLELLFEDCNKTK